MKATHFPLIVGVVLVLGISSCSRGGKPAKGEFYPLKAAGVFYTTPPGWEVVDPPLNFDEIVGYKGRKLRIGFNLIFVQKNIAVGAFYPNESVAVCVACQGPYRPYNGSSPNPLAYQAGTDWEKSWWETKNNPLVAEKKEDVLVLADGTKLTYRQARMTPGVLAGQDVIHGLAFGNVKGRYLAIGAGAVRKGDETAREIEGFIRQIAATVKLDGDGAPAAVRRFD